MGDIPSGEASPSVLSLGERVSPLVFHQRKGEETPPTLTLSAASSRGVSRSLDAAMASAAGIGATLMYGYWVLIYPSYCAAY
jgi:hypothetical protein